MDLSHEPPTKRRRRSNPDNCVICCQPLDTSCPFVESPTLEGVKAVIRAAEIRQVTMTLGAMHLIMAFLATIGKLYGDRGLQNILTSSDVYSSATANQMLQGKQYAHGISGVRLAHEALTHMFLTSAEAFTSKNSLPWLTDEIKQKN